MTTLNTQQQLVAQADSDRIIVLAGAGTGKTASAVTWVANLIKRGVTPEEIVMVTFTKKAAAQMKDRLLGLIGLPAKSVQIGTYHSITAKLMKTHPQAFELKDRDFSILDESDSENLIREAFRRCGQKSRAPLTVGAVKKVYSNAVNRQITITEALSQELEDSEPEIKAILEHYKLLKQYANALDFDDILTRLLSTLKSDFGEQIRKRYTHILVDEFQDNNKLNYAILQAWNPKVLMVIGDKQQSIYGFRGADSELVERFMQDASKLLILKLEKNYRSGQEILNCANKIIKDSAFALELISANAEVADVTLQEFFKPKEEAISVAKAIKRELYSTKAPEIAVLCRAGRGLMPLELELRRAKIEYKKYGGVALADNAAVKDFLSVLRVHYNPRDKVALVRALLLFPKVGEAMAHKFLSLEDANDQSELNLNIEDWPERAKALKAWLEELKQIESLYEKGRFVLEKLTPLIALKYPEDFATRLSDLEEVVGMLKEETSLGDFLELFVLHRGFEKEHPSNAIVLSTIHSAKGLEWDVVFLFNCSHDIIPGKRFHEQKNVKAAIAEEKRLLYVAVTRARYSLHVSSNTESGGLTGLWAG